MKKRRVNKETLQLIEQNFVQSISPTSDDRTVVIVITAYMADVLQEKIQLFFVQDEETLDRLFDPSRNGALSNFSTSIDIAFLLGLISKPVRDWLKLMARIRNIFAHNWETSTFADLERLNDKAIKKVLSQLEHFKISPEADFPLSPPYDNLHPLRLAFDALREAIRVGLDPLVRSDLSERRTEKKMILDNSHGLRDWEEFLLQNFEEKPTKTDE